MDLGKIQEIVRESKMMGIRALSSRESEEQIQKWVQGQIDAARWGEVA
jgi:hypothetical protein